MAIWTEPDRSRERLEAWWNCEVIDRPLVQIFAPRANVEWPPAPQHTSLEEKWLDPAFRIRQAEYYTTRTYYAGDAYPSFNPSIGPGTLALYLGAGADLAEDTIWYTECIEDLATAPLPQYNPDNRYWQLSVRFAREARVAIGDTSAVCFPDLIENLDIVAALAGSQNLLMALFDYPAKLHSLQRAVLDLYKRHYGELYEIIRDSDGGSSFAYCQTYGFGKAAKLQCDFSAMISPAMFEEFVLPYLTEQCEWLEHSVYHLDGVEALKHLDMLLSINALDAIQWTPGAGQPNWCDPVWWPIYHRIRGAGKGLLILDSNPAEARALVEEFGPEGFNLLIGAKSQAEADEVVRDSFNWRRTG